MTDGAYLNNNELAILESGYNQDLNLDGNIGAKNVSFTQIENKGNISLFKDDDGFAYIQKSGGDKIAVTRSDKSKVKITQGSWNIIAADSVSGNNQIIFKSRNTFYKQNLNSNWVMTDGAYIKGNDLYNSEANFKMDLNNDNLIRPIDSLFTPNTLNYEMHDLLSDNFSKPIIEYVGDSERINYFLDDFAGFKYDPRAKANVYTHKYDTGEINFVKDIFDYLDKNIDLDFTRVFDRNLANIEITKVDYNANLGGKNSLGYASTRTDGQRSWMDLWWKNITPNNTDNKYTEYDQLSEDESFTIVHEIGHGLGLAHPRNDPYANWHDSNDTVMTYNRKQINGNKALNFTDADISTLQLVYGKEDDGNSSQKKIPNNAERRKLLNGLNNLHLSAARESNHGEDELIGQYEKREIYEPFEKDELFNYQKIENNTSGSIFENDLKKYENFISNKSIEFETIDIENESIMQEENILISKNDSRKVVQNNSLNDYLFNNSDEIYSNLNSTNFNNQTYS